MTPDIPGAAWLFQRMMPVSSTMFTLTEAIRQVEQALAQGERLTQAVNWVARDYGIEPSLLTRRWVQFTPIADPQPAPVLSSGEFQARYAGK